MISQVDGHLLQDNFIVLMKLRNSQPCSLLDVQDVVRLHIGPADDSDLIHSGVLAQLALAEHHKVFAGVLRLGAAAPDCLAMRRGDCPAPVIRLSDHKVVLLRCEELHSVEVIHPTVLMQLTLTQSYIPVLAERP